MKPIVDTCKPRPEVIQVGIAGCLVLCLIVSTARSETTVPFPELCGNGELDPEETCGEVGLPPCPVGEQCVKCVCRQLGDCLNDGGNVDLFDVLESIDLVLGTHTPSPEQVVLCDDDCDTDIDLFDVLLGIDTILGTVETPLLCSSTSTSTTTTSTSTSTSMSTSTTTSTSTLPACGVIANVCYGTCPSGQACLAQSSFCLGGLAHGSPCSPAAPNCPGGGVCVPSACACATTTSTSTTTSTTLACGDLKYPECNGPCPPGTYCTVNGLVAGDPCTCASSAQCTASLGCWGGFCNSTPPECPPGYYCFRGTTAPLCVTDSCGSDCSCPPTGLTSHPGFCLIF